jgi:hypothetical protein
VRESLQERDVRELLLHFRTRANAEDIEPALLSTRCASSSTRAVSGPRSTCTGHGHSAAPDVQIQVLHIVQEALSNVRKHAAPAQVWLDVQQQPVALRGARQRPRLRPATDRSTKPTSACASCASAPSASAPRSSLFSCPARGTSCSRCPPAQPADSPHRRRWPHDDDRNCTARVRILVVDDHTLFRRGLTALLSRDPQLRSSAMPADAGEAQRRAAELQPDVILLDNHLPGVNGVDACPACARPRRRRAC